MHGANLGRANYGTIPYLGWRGYFIESKSSCPGRRLVSSAYPTFVVEGEYRAWDSVCADHRHAIVSFVGNPELIVCDRACQFDSTVFLVGG